MRHGGKLKPNLDVETTKVLNLTVLQRVDPSVEEILITASHVAFYDFNTNSCQWSRKDVEGSFFVVKREIHGIWFYTAQECEEVAQLFSRILADSEIPMKSKITSTNSEFEDLEAVPTTAVMDGPLEPISCTTANVSEVPDDPAFLSFFSTARNVGGAPNAAISGQPSITAVSTLHPQSFVQPTLASTQIPSNVSAPVPVTTVLDSTNPLTGSKHLTDLLKPSFFGAFPSTAPLVVRPVSSSIPAVSPLYPPVNLQRPYGMPLLQPFPPPTPPPSLTPTSGLPPTDYGLAISREKVREVLQMLVQDGQFIDMVHRAVASAHQAR